MSLSKFIAGSLASLVVASGAGPVSSQAGAAAASASRGKALYLRDGCYQCHGVQGQGAGVFGPRIAPGPIPLQAFTRQLRRPRDAMPVYTTLIMPDAEVADVYAYLQAIPKAKAVADIPLLNR